jgi:gamma-polyglutamate biosynthesis protein CapA
MPRASHATALTLAILVLLVGVLIYTGPIQSFIPSFAINDVEVISLPGESSATTSIIMTGDIMLARHVESLMNKNGSDYPYRDLKWLTDTRAYVVGNFESALPATHVKSPTGTFRFSTAATHIPALKAAGFTHLSLANNHALDYGPTDFVNMQNVLSEHDFETFGHPTKVSTSSVTYLELPDETVAIIGLHTLFNEPSRADLESLMTQVNEKSDTQIAYVHWGVEYEHLPATSQRELATQLIKLGVDLVVGHHPHVTQSVELIDEVPVFYSLGNFIFDQYFSPAVQDGLVLKLEKGSEGLAITLIPVTSRDSQARPRQMTDDERTTYLAKLATWSSPELSAALTSGQLTLPHTLATLTETAIMGE